MKKSTIALATIALLLSGSFAFAADADSAATENSRSSDNVIDDGTYGDGFTDLEPNDPVGHPPLVKPQPPKVKPKSPRWVNQICLVFPVMGQLICTEEP